MLRVEARALLCVCGLSSLVAAIACIEPQPHNEPVAAPHTRADCSGCHEREYKNAPLHVDRKPTRCAVCHSETSWQPTQLTHAWPLTGAHTKEECNACHKGWSPKYEHTDATCVSCHREAGAAASQHASLGSTCQDCHNTEAWRPAKQPLPVQPTPQLVAAPPQPVAATPQLAAATPQPATAAAQRIAAAPQAAAATAALAAASGAAPQPSAPSTAPSEPATAPVAKPPPGAKRTRHGQHGRRVLGTVSKPPNGAAQQSAESQTSASPAQARPIQLASATSNTRSNTSLSETKAPATKQPLSASRQNHAPIASRATPPSETLGSQPRSNTTVRPPPLTASAGRPSASSPKLAPAPPPAPQLKAGEIPKQRSTSPSAPAPSVNAPARAKAPTGVASEKSK